MSPVSSPYISFNYSTERYRYYLLILLLIFWPFGAFLYALYYYDKIESKVILVLFTALFGYSLVAEFQYMDLARVMQSFPSASRLSYRDFNDSRLKVGLGESSVDIYRDMVTFLVSRFTSNAKWLMCTFGIIAGYVYTKVLSLFISEQAGRNIYKYLLVISFSCIVSIDQLSGVRMSLAAYVFFYGAIKVINKGDKRYLIVVASSVLIHFSFLPAVLLLIVFPILKKYPKIIYLILVLSFILPDLLKSYILQYSEYFGKGIEGRTELYYGLVSDLKYGSDTTWYVRDRIISMLIFCYLFFFITRIKKNTIIYSDKTNDLFFFSLIILSFVNFTMDIPHFGYRFQYVFLMFAFFYIYKVYTENSPSTLISNLVLISFPFSLLMIVFSLRSTLSITSLTFYYFNLTGLFIDQSAHSAWTTIF
jgi:hypothetical protein